MLCLRVSCHLWASGSVGWMAIGTHKVTTLQGRCSVGMGAHGRSTGLPKGLGHQTVPRCVCSGFGPAEGQEAEPLLLFQRRDTVLCLPRDPAWAGHPAMARRCQWAPHGTITAAVLEEREGSRVGLPTTLGGLWAPPLCVLDAATYPSCAGSLGAPGGCVWLPGRPRNSRDLPHPAWQRLGPRGLRAPG